MKTRNIEPALAIILTAGAIASAFLTAAGLIWAHYSGGEQALSKPLSADDLFALVRTDVLRLEHSQYSPRTTIGLGIAILMLTPYLAVATSTLNFLMRRDLRYVALAGFVWAFLTYSILFHH